MDLKQKNNDVRFSELGVLFDLEHRLHNKLEKKAPIPNVHLIKLERLFDLNHRKK